METAQGSNSHYVHVEGHSCVGLGEAMVVVAVPGAGEPEEAEDEDGEGGVEAALGLGSQHRRVGCGYMVLGLRAREERRGFRRLFSGGRRRHGYGCGCGWVPSR